MSEHMFCHPLLTFQTVQSQCSGRPHGPGSPAMLTLGEASCGLRRRPCLCLLVVMVMQKMPVHGVGKEKGLVCKTCTKGW